MSKLIYQITLLLALVIWISSASKSFSCMSFMENDEDDYDEFSVNETSESIETHNSNPHRRTCLIDYTFCFALWRQTANGAVIEKQGCWKDRTERNATCYQSECSSSAPTFRNNSLYYCCCSGDVCNQKVAVVEPTPLQLSKEILPEASNLSGNTTNKSTNWSSILFWCALLVPSVMISVASVYLYFRNGKEKPMPEEAPLAPSGPGYSSNLHNVDNINLICMLGSGKYGTVMKGLLHDKEVAVKIYPETHHQYYINERNIYSLPMMDSPALLQYFGYDERRTMDDQMEYQLVLSLAPLGCLQDWLIANSMDFQTFCSMAKSITRGLSHLHTEIRRGEEFKPCIAHRDLNSRNVLIKADKTCCIADFGFALKVFGAKYEYKGEVAMAETKSINEVGTLRYMAPELLEGAVNLRDCETSLKQMDVYALGLVLWEVATRCVDFYAQGQITPPYKAPYEQEVGTHPTFDQMQTLVVRHKARPLFPAGWGGGTAAKLVRDTCEDCWDHDAEARLTSLCAEERMQEVACLCPKLQPHAQATSPFLNTNNLVRESAEFSQQTIINEEMNNETTTMLNPPPNQQIPSRVQSGNGIPNTHNLSSTQTEKNHLIYTQQPLQPYQGRNPCLERNLAPVAKRPEQIFVEKSKKHSFQTAEENSFSCLEDDVSVEELISGNRTSKFNTLPQDVTNMGEGFPKQQNTDKKLRGWHSIRAVIQKKLFRKEQSADLFRQMNYGDEKSNLVDNRLIVVVNGNEKPPNSIKSATVSFIDDRPSPKGIANAKTTTLDTFYPQHKRPNNLDLSPLGARGGVPFTPECNKLNLIHTIAEEDNGNTSLRPILQSLDTRTSTPAHVVPRSLSTSLIKNQSSNNNLCATELKLVNANSLNTRVIEPKPHGERQFKRQRSLEVFREVFSGRGSTERLRDPSQRVKTPGDVPPSVRRIRASKTLSLYDDRMMDSSTLNIL